MPVSVNPMPWVGMLLLLPHGKLAAQDPTPPATDIDAVTVQGARYDARRDETASRIVAGREELARHGDTLLTDALKRLPGVTVGVPAPGRSGAIALRGMGAGYTQVLLDGQLPPVGFDIDSLTPQMVERVEILRSATADQRAEAIAGTINIVLASAKREDSDRVQLAWAAASNGRQVPSATWQRNRQQGPRSDALIATVSRRAFGVEESAAEREWDATGAERIARSSRLRSEGSRSTLNLSPSMELQLDEDNTLRLQGSAEGSRFERITDIEWDTQRGAPLRHVQYRQQSDVEVALLRGDVRWTRKLEEGGTFEAKLGVGGNRERNQYREHGRDIQGQPSMEEHTAARLRVHGISSSGSHAPSGVGRHSMRTGWEASLDGRREDRMQAIQYPGSNDPDMLSDLGFDAEIRRLAFYTQDEFTVGPRWSVYLGARWERIETTSEGSGFMPIRNRQQMLAPVLQSLWKLGGGNEGNDHDSTRLRVAFSRTFKAPTLGSIMPRPYTTTNNRPLNPDQIGNPALRPERATGLDLSLETDTGNGSRFNIGGYLRKIDDVVRTELRQQEGRWMAMPVNGADATAWGLEMDGSLTLSKVFKGFPPIDLRFNATRAWSRVDDVQGPYNRIPEQVPFSATLGADYRISPRWSTGISYGHGSSREIQTTPIQLDFASARRELDIHANWTLNAATRLHLSASNLLQQELDSGQRYLLAGESQELTRSRRGTALFRVQLEIQL
ncbi:TonB-dependent receptor plug domain-containing protein [Stenotrophomonas tumulicola]|uniref:TonB-dependent receptor n=1 Tax=Stenotrophomonas tumulicola TaxID=1685415 RepID=A0A7W3FKJ9_9GAMM|nr:TonB-dependent receptor [Stenotrophomonas tumulicola]MBA8680926.1 TonB-dependent receptor [Stenotrophomonas tumulicola]